MVLASQNNEVNSSFGFADASRAKAILRENVEVFDSEGLKESADVMMWVIVAHDCMVYLSCECTRKGQKKLSRVEGLSLCSYCLCLVYTSTIISHLLFRWLMTRMRFCATLLIFLVYLYAFHCQALWV